MNATYKCADCPASFWDVEDLIRHRKAHEEPVPVSFSCAVCSARFATEAEGDRHYYEAHGDGARSSGTKFQTLAEQVLAQQRRIGQQINDALDAIKLPDHHAAAVAALRKLADRIEQGISPEDVGPDVVLLGRLLSRRT